MENKNNEEKIDEGAKISNVDTDKGAQTKNEERDLITEARKENDRREKILEEEKALQARKERLHAEQMATGRGIAGVRLNEQDEKKAKSKEFWKGTGIDEAIDRYGIE